MDFLKVNDSSLQYSMELASNMGYEVKNLNVCILASLVKEEDIKDSFYRHTEEIQEFFEELPTLVRNYKIESVLDGD